MKKKFTQASFINGTVEEVIEELKKFDPKAIVCKYNPLEDEDEANSTVEVISEIDDAEYIDDAGEKARGKIISIY